MSDKQNIVKETAKALGMTQKELAERIGVNKDTLGNWARGAIETPKWAIKLFELLLIEKKFNTIKRLISEEIDKKD